MTPYYKHVSSVLKTPLDSALVKAMESANHSMLQGLSEKIDDAVANLGETEHSDALIARALYLSQIGEKV
jgi:26S proteasome regulatory subunit N7